MEWAVQEKASREMFIISGMTPFLRPTSATRRPTPGANSRPACGSRSDTGRSSGPFQRKPCFWVRVWKITGAK